MLDHAAPFWGKFTVKAIWSPCRQDEIGREDRQKHQNGGGNHATDAGIRFGWFAVGISHLRAAFALEIAATTEAASS
jgi:hypothetical protein